MREEVLVVQRERVAMPVVGEPVPVLAAVAIVVVVVMQAVQVPLGWQP